MASFPPSKPPSPHIYPSRPIISGQFWQKDITTTLNHNELLLSAISVQRMEWCQIPASFIIGCSGNSYTISDHGFTNCRTTTTTTTTTTNNNNNNNNNNKSFIIIIIIIIIIISFMQGIYTYIPETNYIPMEYSVAAILLLLFIVLISLVSVLNLLCF